MSPRTREFMVLKLYAPCARARARTLSLLHGCRASIPKPVNTKDKLSGCACVRGCLGGGRASAFCRSSSSRGQLGSYLHSASQDRRRVLESARARADKVRAGGSERKEWVGWLRRRIEIYRSGQSLRRNSVND